MKGLELSRRFFSEIVYPAFAAGFPDLKDSMAFGLAGPGSECLGFDDSISRDHDWGPRVCIWVPEIIHESRGKELQNLYDELEGPFLGFDAVHRLDIHAGRDGVLSIQGFFKRLLGIDSAPVSLSDWLPLKEEALSECTGGEVFLDTLMEFSEFRAVLNRYYPRDLWLKKMSSRCKVTGRHGQYDLVRALRRADDSAARHHLAGFSYGIASLAHLVHRTYRPYGKWIFRSLEGLGGDGPVLRGLLAGLDVRNPVDALKVGLDSSVQIVSGLLKRQGLLTGEAPSLFDAGLEIEKQVENRFLREEIYSID